MSDLDLAVYAARLGIAVPDVIELPALQRLHEAHVGAIAFENLDVQWRRTIRIDAEAATVSNDTGQPALMRFEVTHVEAS